MELTPKRCPLLEGNYNEKKFTGISDKNKEESKFNFRCMRSQAVFNSGADIVYERGCLTTDYLHKCERYAQETFRITIAIPLVCPQYSSKDDYCISTEDPCDLAHELVYTFTPEEDYRSCPVFSKWFWSANQPASK